MEVNGCHYSQIRYNFFLSKKQQPGMRRPRVLESHLVWVNNTECIRSSESHFLKLWAHIRTFGTMIVTSIKAVADKMACRDETQKARATVTTASSIVTRILCSGQRLSVLLRNIGSCPNIRTASRIKVKTEDKSGSRDASTTEADRAALMESTDERLIKANIVRNH
jgi:hypothetical protein